MTFSFSARQTACPNPLSLGSGARLSGRNSGDEWSRVARTGTALRTCEHDFGGRGARGRGGLVAAGVGAACVPLRGLSGPPRPTADPLCNGVDPQWGAVAPEWSREGPAWHSRISAGSGRPARAGRAGSAADSPREPPALHDGPSRRVEHHHRVARTPQPSEAFDPAVRVRAADLHPRGAARATPGPVGATPPHCGPTLQRSGPAVGGSGT